ncbi:MAG: hypothetical protein HKN31_06950 [Pricia sp.]|nr:hypothetical protein [Pricia sp.]
MDRKKHNFVGDFILEIDHVEQMHSGVIMQCAGIWNMARPYYFPMNDGVDSTYKTAY